MISQTDLQNQQEWQPRLQSLWPAVKGSLAKVRKPCIRDNCAACARGDKHPAWMFCCSLRGRRQTLYVPLAAVAPLARAIENGRKIEALLSRAGPKLIKQYRKTAKKRAKSGSKT